MVKSIFELSDLNGVNGFTINGVAVSDGSGYPVSAAGDVNGDGLGDLIIGAWQADPNGKSEAGQSYVIFGGAESFSANQLRIEHGKSLQLNTSHLAVEPLIGNRTLTVSNVEQGRFEVSANPGVAVTQFTQQQIIDKQVLFVHNGSDVAPSYIASAEGITRVFSDVQPQAGNVSFAVSATSTSTSTSTAGTSTSTSTSTSVASTSTSTSSSTLAPVLTSTSTTLPSTSSSSTSKDLSSTSSTSSSSTSSLLISLSTRPTTTSASSSSASVASSPEDAGSKASASTALLLGATLGGIAGVVAVSVMLALWMRHRRHKQRVGLEGQVNSSNVIAMEENPLHAGTGTRSWDPAFYETHRTDAVRAREWDAATYDIQAAKAVAAKNWDPALYALQEESQGAGLYAVPRYEECTTYDEDDDVKGAESQQSGRRWDPGFYAVGKDDHATRMTRNWKAGDYELGTNVSLGQTNV